jgi:phosphonatase-like hydrolase
MTERMVDLVVLDMAGTTVHDGDAVAECFLAAMAAAGLEISRKQANSVMGLPKPEAIRRLVAAAANSSELSPRIEAIHADFIHRMKQHYQSSPDIREVDGATSVFEQLKSAGIRVALNTGFSREIVDVLIERLGWNRNSLIDAVVTSDEVARGRPYPDMILQLMAKLKVSSASRVAKAGDTPADLMEGTAAGCRYVIGVTNGTHTAAELKASPHTHLIDSITELPGLLQLPAP